MHWFIDPIKNHYADFDGRIGRQEYWMFFLFGFLLSVAFDIIGVEVLGMIVSLALFVPSIAMATRRLHDTGRSGWWQLLWFIPIVGWIILIVWLVTETIHEDNMYGAPAVPKTGPEGVAPTAAASTTTASDSSVPMASTADTKSENKPDNTPETAPDSGAESSSSAEGGGSSN